MLRAIKDNLEHLDNRQLVDTVYSLGKLHQFKGPASLYIEKANKDWHNKLFPFFNHLLNDFLDQAKVRVADLKQSEIAFLAKGLISMRKLIYHDPVTTQKEQDFREALLAHLNKDHTLLASFDPYSISKLLRYLLQFNDASSEAEEVFKSLSLLLTQTIADRQASLVNAKMKDPLIDIEAGDLVDIVRVYSVFAQLALQSEEDFETSGYSLSEKMQHVPGLFDELIKEFREGRGS